VRLLYPWPRVCVTSFGALMCAAGIACTSHGAAPGPAHRALPEAARASVEASALRDGRELAKALPPDAERCTVVMPSRVSESQRPLLALVSQVDRLPWALRSQVTAYARAELTPRGDRRRVVELIRFSSGTAAELRQDLTEHVDRVWTWDHEPVVCDDPLTCVVTRAQFIDARTVRVTTGDWPYEGDSGSDCVELLERVPQALEVSARHGSESLELGSVERWLVASTKGLTRVERRAYADPSAAERARVKVLEGYHDGPVVAGVPVHAELDIEGKLLAETVHIAWDDLQLVVQDQERLRHALDGSDQRTPSSDDGVDVADVEVVRAHVDARIAAIERVDQARQRASLLSLRDLLVRAREVHPADEGLARRHFALSLFGLGDAPDALSVAQTMLDRGALDSGAWALSLRIALSQVDEGRLRNELASVHGLAPHEAAKMAASLFASAKRGEDYERSEWAFLMARSLGQRARAQRLVDAPALALSPGLFVRMLTTLAVAGAEADHAALGVHVLILGGDVSQPLPARDDSLWVQRTDALGAPAVALAATSWDGAQVLSLARTLDALAPAASGEIWLAFDPLRHPDRQGTMVRLAFHRTDTGFVLDRVSKNLARVRWPLLVRELADPLSRFEGTVFPPDGLTMEALSAEELGVWTAAAARVDGVTCTTDGSVLSCRGTMHDNLAAERALRGIVRISLAPEVRIFTSGVD